MAEIPLPEHAAERYAALERTYVEERWSSVAADGQTLLEELEESDDPQAESLANRVRVLIGHTYLYGLLEAVAAEDYYRAVLSGRAEPELRRIAAEGLRQCQRPPTSEALPVETTTASRPELSTPISAAKGDPNDPFLAAISSAASAEATSHGAGGPAMPWLKDLVAGGANAADQIKPSAVAPGGNSALVPRLEVEVVEEPELVEVAQADPDLSQELELELTRIRERRAARAAVQSPAAAGFGEAAERPASQDPEAAFAAAITAATAEITASGLDDERSGEPVVVPPSEPAVSRSDSIRRTDTEPRPLETTSTSEQEARVETTLDPSDEDQDLMAGLLRVKLLN